MTDGSVVWSRLTDSDHERVWDDFVDLTSFRRVRPGGWPGILEPSPSVTWDLARERPTGPRMIWHFAAEPDDVNVLLHDATAARSAKFFAATAAHPGEPDAAAEIRNQRRLRSELRRRARVERSGSP